MYSKILVPLDTSPMAEQAILYSQKVALPETTIHLVGVVEPNLYSYALATHEAVVREKLQTVIHCDMEQYLAEVEQRLRHQGIRVESWLANGDAAQTIADVATKIGANLIAMTTSGRTGLRRLALGSVADRLIHIAQQPILLIRNQAALPTAYTIRRILVPVDGSVLAEAALTQAKGVALSQGAELVLLRVVEPLSDWQKKILAEGGYSAALLAEERHQEAERYLADTTASLQTEQLAVTSHLCHGIASEKILHLIDQEPFDLVVMSTHGLSGYSRWVYGSVAGNVLHSAACPLLLVRGVDMQRNNHHSPVYSASPDADLPASGDAEYTGAGFSTANSA